MLEVDVEVCRGEIARFNVATNFVCELLCPAVLSENRLAGSATRGYGGHVYNHMTV
jgi:hypothetical protein